MGREPADLGFSPGASVYKSCDLEPQFLYLKSVDVNTSLQPCFRGSLIHSTNIRGSEDNTSQPRCFVLSGLPPTQADPSADLGKALRGGKTRPLLGTIIRGSHWVGVLAQRMFQKQDMLFMELRGWRKEGFSLILRKGRRRDRHTDRQIETAPEWTPSLLLPRQQP